MADRQKLDRNGLLHLLVVYLVWGSRLRPANQVCS